MNEKFVDPFGKPTEQAGDEGRKESYSERLKREGGAVASGKFAEANESGVPQGSDENPDPEDPDREQALRDRMGYSPNEKRSKAERDAAAQRMVAKSKPKLSAKQTEQLQALDEALATSAPADAPDLPADIAAIWGHHPVDIETAQHLIEAWGLDRFRDSQLHKAALQEARSAKDRAANQRAFLDAQKRLKK